MTDLFLGSVLRSYFEQLRRVVYLEQLRKGEDDLRMADRQLQQARDVLGLLIRDQLAVQSDFGSTIKKLIKILDNKLVIPSAANIPLTKESCARELTRLNIRAAYLIHNGHIYYVTKNMEPKLLTAKDHGKEAELRDFCIRVTKWKTPGHMSTLLEQDMQTILLLTKEHLSLEDIVKNLQQAFEGSKRNREKVERLLKDAEKQKKEIAEQGSRIAAQQRDIGIGDKKVEEIRRKIAVEQSKRRLELLAETEKQQRLQRELAAAKAEQQRFTSQLEAEQEKYRKKLVDPKSIVETKRQEVARLQNAVPQEEALAAREEEEIKQLRRAIVLTKERLAQQEQSGAAREVQEFDNMSNISVNTAPERIRLPLTVSSLSRMVCPEGREEAWDTISDFSTYTLPVGVQGDRKSAAYAQHIERVRFARDAKKAVKPNFRMRH